MFNQRLWGRGRGKFWSVVFADFLGVNTHTVFKLPM